MRFFLEFVFCCGTTTQRTAVQTTTDSLQRPLAAAEEEERSLVPPFSRTRRQKKRGKLGESSAATPEWRPSLGAISEDNIVPPRARSDGVRNGKVGPEREVSKRSAAGAAAKVQHRNYGDDNKRLVVVPAIMPAFSPTPFMF